MESMNNIVGVTLAIGLPKINNLFFADDCLLFVKADLRQLKELKSLHDKYEKDTGQKIYSLSLSLL